MSGYFFLYGLAFANPEWLQDTIGQVLVAQAIVGIIALIGLIATLRRFLSNEFPAAMRQVDSQLERLHKDLETLREDFNEYRVRFENLKTRVESMSGRPARDPDDTASRRRPPRT